MCSFFLLVIIIRQTMNKWILILLVLVDRMGMKKETDVCCSADYLQELDNLKTFAMLKPTHSLPLNKCIKHPVAYELVKATLNMIRI